MNICLLLPISIGNTMKTVISISGAINMENYYLATVLAGALVAGLLVGLALIKLTNRSMGRKKNGNHAV